MRVLNASIVLGVLVSASLAVPVEVAQAAPVRITAAWSDGEIVDGIVFGEGPVARTLGIESQLDPDAPADAVATALSVEAGLREQMLSAHARDVANAAKLVTSGDPYKVEDGQAILAETFRRASRRCTPNTRRGSQPTPDAASSPLAPSVPSSPW